MPPASNTKDCFRLLLDHRVVGLLFDALPNNGVFSDGSTAVLLDDGSALVIHENGSYHVERPAEVRRAVDRKRRQLEATQRELRDVLNLVGAFQDAEVRQVLDANAEAPPHAPWSARNHPNAVATDGNDTVTARDEPKLAFLDHADAMRDIILRETNNSDPLSAAASDLRKAGTYLGLARRHYRRAHGLQAGEETQ